MMKYFMVVVLVCAVAGTAIAEDTKFVGVWEGPFNTPIYTKLVFHDDQSLTYCDVMSCRQINCMKMDFEGSLSSRFSYVDLSGKWEFERLSEDEIEGRFTNQEGDVSVSFYEPE